MFKKPKCLIIVITDETDTDMTKEAHSIIYKAQQTRDYEVHSMVFEPIEIKRLLRNKDATIHETVLEQLDVNAERIQSYFDKVIILGHCNYYTINYDSYYNDPFLSHEATSIHGRTICGLSISQICKLIKYLITQLDIYHISLCCCESGTKKVHLECEWLDELTEEEEHIYNHVEKLRLNHDILVEPQFVNRYDEQDKHLFVAFEYTAQYAMSIRNQYNRSKRKNKINSESISDQTLSVLDLISNAQKILGTLKRKLIINALNGFGYYRHPQMSQNELNRLQHKLGRMQRHDQESDTKDNNITSIGFELDKEFVSGPLRHDCIYYSIKDRDGVQWLIDKDDNNLHKKQNWCYFEMTQILDFNCANDRDSNDIMYNEKQFVSRAHVIQYQFKGKKRKKRS